MNNHNELNKTQFLELFDLIHKSNPYESLVGLPHNPTTKTTAKIKLGTKLHVCLKKNSWFTDGMTLTYHGSQCSDVFHIQHRFQVWDITHIPVG